MPNGDLIWTHDAHSVGPQPEDSRGIEARPARSVVLLGVTHIPCAVMLTPKSSWK